MPLEWPFKSYVMHRRRRSPIGAINLAYRCYEIDRSRMKLDLHHGFPHLYYTRATLCNTVVQTVNFDYPCTKYQIKNQLSITFFAIFVHLLNNFNSSYGSIPHPMCVSSTDAWYVWYPSCSKTSLAVSPRLLITRVFNKWCNHRPNANMNYRSWIWR